MIASHSIKKHYLHVEFMGSESQAFALQNELPVLCNDWLFPALEQVFNRFSPGDDTYCIDRLDIDAGSLNLDRLQHDLAEIVTSAVEKQLQGQLAHQIEKSDIPAKTVHRKTRRQSCEEVFIYFLNIGRLPWSYSLPKNESLESHILDAWSQKKPNSIYLLNNLRIALNSPAARKRLICQFSEDLLQTLLLQIGPNLHKIIQSLLYIVKNASLSTQETNSFTQYFWEIAYRHFADGDWLTEQQFIAEVLETLPIVLQHPAKIKAALESRWSTLAYSPDSDGSALSNTLAKQNLLYSIIRVLVHSGLSTEIVNEFEKQLLKAASNYSFEPGLTEQEIVSRAWHEMPELSVKSELKFILESHWLGITAPVPNSVSAYGKTKDVPKAKTFETESKKSDFAQSATPDMEEGIYIENAGLVLLHPFLPQFFTALKIAEDDKLIQPERALCLLHFLTTGETIAPEYALVLPKLLCKVPLTKPVAMDVELTEVELDEAVALLEAVIRHWDVLKNTGIEGFRNTFLLRSGKLSQREDGDWRLQVENKAFDILMGQLPWGISMIKLPWMKQMLWVEWG